MELLDICDEQGNPTGETVERDIAHRDGILHRTAHVWIVRNKDKGFDILLQKRSMEKESFPGLFDTSSAGHIPAGDDPVTSALFFASPFWKKLQSKNGQPCMSKKDKVARIPGTHGAGMNPLQTGYLYQR